MTKNITVYSSDFVNAMKKIVSRIAMIFRAILDTNFFEIPLKLKV